MGVHYDKQPIAPCGTPQGYKRHKRMGEEQCKPCLEAKRAYQRDYYSKNKDRYRAHVRKYMLNNKDKVSVYRDTHRVESRERNRVRDKEHRDFIQNYKTSKGCVDCGYNGHPAALDFDHLGDKKFQISTPPNKSDKEGILREIAKCEVVCANCHRIRTANRLRPKLEDDDPAPDGKAQEPPEDEVTPELK